MVCEDKYKVMGEAFIMGTEAKLTSYESAWSLIRWSGVLLKVCVSDGRLLVPHTMIGYFCLMELRSKLVWEWFWQTRRTMSTKLTGTACNYNTYWCGSESHGKVSVLSRYHICLAMWQVAQYFLSITSHHRKLNLVIFWVYCMISSRNDYSTKLIFLMDLYH